MARIFADVASFEAALESAVNEIMESVVADEMVKEIQTFARNRFYRYAPQYRHRRVTRGGMIDPENMEVNYDPVSHELTIDMVADWQWKGFRRGANPSLPDGDLVDVVQENQIYNAPPRSFVPEAEAYYQSRRLDRTLERELQRYGF